MDLSSPIHSTSHILGGIVGRIVNRELETLQKQSRTFHSPLPHGGVNFLCTSYFQLLASSFYFYLEVCMYDLGYGMCIFCGLWCTDIWVGGSIYIIIIYYSLLGNSTYQYYQYTSTSIRQLLHRYQILDTRYQYQYYRRYLVYFLLLPTSISF